VLGVNIDTCVGKAGRRAKSLYSQSLPSQCKPSSGPTAELNVSIYIYENSLLANSQCTKAADSLCACPDVSVLIVHIFTSDESRVPKSTSVTLSVGMQFHPINMKNNEYILVKAL